MTLEEVLRIAFPSGALSGVIVAFLARHFVDIQVKKAVGKYEAELQRKTEGLKSDLSVNAYEAMIGLTRLEELRAAAIQEIYTQAIAWQELFLELTQPNLPKRATDAQQLQLLMNRSQNLLTASEKLSILVRDKAPFFDEQSYEVLWTFGKVTMNLSTDFYDATFGAWERNEDPDYPALFAAFNTERAKLRASAKDEYDKAQNTLVVEFRKLMKAERLQPLTR